MTQSETKLIAYHGKKSDKTAQLKIVKQKIADGRLIHGTYGEMRDGVMKGCAVFVATCNSERPHELFEELFGVPRVLAKYEDVIFENLPVPKDSEFAYKFWEAVPVGADLSRVSPQFQYWLMQENLKNESLWRKHGKNNEYVDKVVAAVKQVAELMKKWAETGVFDESAARYAAESATGSAVESAARSARYAAESARSAWYARSAVESAARSARYAWYAAESATGSAVESAVESAARSAWYARYAAESATGSAVESAARSARYAVESAARSARSARSDFYIRASEKLLELLSQAPVVVEVKND